MNAERLREAAKVLRERAEGAGCEFGHQWRVDGMYQVVTVESDPPGAPVFGCMACEADQDSAQYAGYPYTCEETAFYIATMSPMVGLALADWLDAITKRAEEVASTLAPNSQAREPIVNSLLAFREAVAVADAILGGAQ